MVRRLVAKPRSAVTTFLEVSGFGVVSFGIWQVSAPAGTISAGIGLVLIGWLAA